MTTRPNARRATRSLRVLLTEEDFDDLTLVAEGMRESLSHAVRWLIRDAASAVRGAEREESAVRSSGA